MAKRALGGGLIAAILCVGLALPAAGQTPPDFTELVSQHRHAVVSVSVRAESRPRAGAPGLPFELPEESPFLEFFRDFFGQFPAPDALVPQATLGSGFIISPDGYILTNAHVLETDGQVTVGLADRREFVATVVGRDPRADIGLLKVEAEGLPAVTIGDSDALRVGEWVLAIGSPFGLDHTATQGIVSAVGRSLPGDPYVPFIQTDAAVNPGNSGGPLFNLNGEVIGINSQIYTRHGGFMGVSFAVPINVAMEVAEQLRTTGEVVRGWLGAQIQDVTRELAESFGLEEPRGALVAAVLPDSPGADAGLRIGDIILAFGNMPVDRSSELPPQVGRTAPGTTVTLTIVREGQQQTLPVTIGRLPDESTARDTAPAQAADRLGLVVSAATEGVRVAEVRPGPAAQAGLRRGDLILRIGDRRIDSLATFRQQVSEMPANRPVSFLVQRGTQTFFVTITAPE